MSRANVIGSHDTYIISLALNLLISSITSLSNPARGGSNIIISVL